MNQHLTDQLCQQYLEMLFKNPSTYYKPDNIAQTSGEILYGSIHKLLPYMQLTMHDIFADLGSANGKIIAQIFLTTAVKRVVGIEIVPELHKAAYEVSQRIQSECPQFYENDRKMILMQGDFLRIPLEAITVVLTNATCFPPSLVAELGKVINKTPSIRAVFSLRPIFTLERLAFKKVIPIECSWDTALCYWYGARIEEP